MKKNILLMFVIGFLASACSTMQSWFGMGEQVPEKKHSVVTTPKFSDNPNLMVTSNRQYKKTTRSKLEEESELQAQAGSMWVMEGQGAYLFSQNKTRKEGDLLNVKVEGSAQKQVETKVSVIKKLLKQLEEQEQQQQQQLKEQKLAAEGKAENRQPASEPKVEKKTEEKDEPLSLDVVPTRITERMPDGNYRVKGQQPFMIGKREYKVIVTGIIRAEDYNDEGVSSNKLLDPQFDVVSLRKKNTEVN